MRLKKSFGNLLIILIIFLLLSGQTFAGVMMQGFYWDVPQGNWYNTMKSKAAELSAAGFTAIWFPSPVKGASGGYSMGYDPFDFYDLGEYNQKGTVKTRFGSKNELIATINTYKSYGMQTYVDTVLNHMMGGELEWNPYTKSNTWTKFTYPHGKFQKNYEHFHPNFTHPDNNPPYHGKDFGEDLCFYNDYNYVGNQLKEWGKWLKNDIGFDGFRLDYVKGMEPEYIKSWVNTWPMNQSFVVGEYWDGNRDAINWWVNYTGAHAFDFPLWSELREMCNADGWYDMRRLQGAGLVAINPIKAVTFIENHDTDKDYPIYRNKHLAYAFILTAEGYPTVFWKDYYNYGMKPIIDNLVWIHENLAHGTTTYRWADQDLLVYERNGGNKLLVGINDSGYNKTVTVNTGFGAWTWVKDYTGTLQGWIQTDGQGRLTITVPARGYVAYSR